MASSVEKVAKELVDFRGAVGRDIENIHTRIDKHEKSTDEKYSDLCSKLENGAFNHEPAKPAAPPPSAEFVKLCEKDEATFKAQDNALDTVAVGREANSKFDIYPTEGLVHEFFTANMPASKFLVRTKISNTIITVKFEAVNDKSAVQWAEEGTSLRQIASSTLGFWLNQEHHPKTRNFLTPGNNFVNRLKSKAGKRRISYEFSGCYLVVNGIVIGPPSIFPPPSSTDIAVKQILEVIDALPPYFEPSKDPRTQVPEEVVAILFPLRAEPKFFKLSG